MLADSPWNASTEWTVQALGLGEILVIAAIVLLLLGPSKLPRLGEGLGSAIANFRKAVRGDEAERTASRGADRPRPLSRA